MTPSSLFRVTTFCLLFCGIAVYSVFGFGLACYRQNDYVNGFIANYTTIGNRTFAPTDYVRSARWRQNNEGACVKLCNGTIQLAATCGNSLDWAPINNTNATKVMIYNSSINPFC
ncbi:hypothetical protein Fcan01_27780 [Folsomia candida]|uniref:Uncharacterized protein n=1 Tax=Folsomia candida TaxID=158441 RepID=A0A226CVN4_FOLCA|nr:hypothetical protein Fcan01_27780 [Folsomia candida]